MGEEDGLKAYSKPRGNRQGIYFALVYIFIVLAVFALTASSKPSGLGYEWIPFIYLAMPWSLSGANIMTLILGFTANAVILYLLGTVVAKVWCRIFRK